MASGEPKTKVIVGADTSEFTKGIKAAKADMRAFGDVSNDVLKSFGSALGLDVNQIEQLSSAIRGAGQKLGQMGSEGSAAFRQIVSGASAAGAALAGIGIAGATLAFKALTAEAENFKNTVAGANIELQTQAYVQTYQQVMHDFVSDTGQSVAEAESKWKKFWGTLSSNVKTYFASGALKEDFSPWSSDTSRSQAYVNQQNQAKQAAEDAARITGEIYQIDRQRSDNLVKIAQLDRDIAEYQRIMKSETASLAERQSAYDAATQAINDKYALQLPLMQKRASLMVEMGGLAANSIADTDATNQAQVEAIKLEEQQADELRGLERLGNSITSANNANNAALRKQLELQRQIAQSRADLAALDLGVAGGLSTGATTGSGGIIPQTIDTVALQQQINAALGDSLFLELGIQIEKGSLIDLSNQVSSVLAGLAESMSAAIGGLIGDLITGGDAWGNFANAALSAFGDMATSVGKIAIECGIAALGIKAALVNLGPAGAAMAIAAGTALVALGAAVKAGLSNVANGNYSAGGYVASGSYSSYSGGDYETRDIQVNVTGTLEADGDKLVAVISGTNNKKGYTT